jgi:hypothetical protein
MAGVSDWYVGKRLFVGISVPPAANLGIGPAEIRGSAFIEGPLDVGSPIFAPGESNVCISRCINPDALKTGPLPISLVKIRNTPGVPALPTDVIIGDLAGPVGVTVFCGPSFFTVTATSVNLLEQTYFNLNVLRDEVSSMYTDLSNKIFTGYKSELGVDHNFAFAINSAPILGETITNFSDHTTKATTLNTTFSIAESKKSFDIPHPTKEDHRLRYVCLEGPEAEVFYRGRMENTTTINLPDYWRELVDPDSIGVHLTPMGSYQDLFVEKIEWGTKVTVKNASGGPIRCSYVVFGVRNDVERNIPEYQGLTSKDYPGDNSDYNVNK